MSNPLSPKGAASSQAATIVKHIEKQTRYVRSQMESVVKLILYGKVNEDDFFHRSESQNIRIRDIERFYDSWQSIVPSDNEVKANITAILIEKYGISAKSQPRIAKLLNIDEQQNNEASIREDRSALSVALDQLNLEILQDSLEYVYLSSGETLFNEGDLGDSLYVVTSGRLDVVIGQGDAARKIAERSRFDIIGDMALLLDAPRSASLIASRDSELWRISQDVFESLLHTYPDLTLQLVRSLASRLATANQSKRFRRHANAIALVSAGRNIRLGEFTQELMQRVQAFGSVQHLNSQKIAEQFEPDTAQSEEGSLDYIRLSGWINEQENRHKFIIYEADADLSNWTRRCLKQCDLVLLIGRSDDSSALNEIEEALFNTDEFSKPVRKNLVLIHPSGQTLPTQTTDWLRLRDVDSHHHIMESREADLKRLARITVGKPIALVMSGGTVRSFAHIGMLRALKEVGIPIDAISGTSSGSIVAGQVAMGMSPEEMYDQNKALFENAGKLFDLTLPYTSVIAAHKFTEVLEDMFGDIYIEDLWTRYFCTTSDLTVFETRVHSSGLLRRAIRASCSVPDILPPVIMDGHMLIDGGATNNLPVSHMLEFIGDGTVLLSNIIPDFYPDDSQYDYGDSLQFWKVVNHKFNPFKKNKFELPTMFDINRRAAECSARAIQLEEIERADYYIRPQLGEVAPTQTSKIPHLYETGYKDTMALLEKWDIAAQLV